MAGFFSAVNRFVNRTLDAIGELVVNEINFWARLANCVTQPQNNTPHSNTYTPPHYHPGAASIGFQQSYPQYHYAPQQQQWNRPDTNAQDAAQEAHRLACWQAYYARNGIVTGVPVPSSETPSSRYQNAHLSSSAPVVRGR